MESINVFPKETHHEPIQDLNGMKTKQSQVEKMQRDTCFRCKLKGHWANNCPSQSMIKSQPSMHSEINSAIPAKQCPCGGGLCKISMSKTERNPGRMFYRCPNKFTDAECKFFQWCDDVTSHPTYIDSRDSIPMCPCGAGKCRILTKTDGNIVNRKYYGCTVKKGHGACSFFQWVDSPSKEDIINTEPTSLHDQITQVDL